MITKQQALELNEFHDDAPSQRRDNSCYVWRRNGATRTWKTRPDDFRVPVKYGLREYGEITPTNNHAHAPDDPACPMMIRREHKAGDAYGAIADELTGDIKLEELSDVDDARWFAARHSLPWPPVLNAETMAVLQRYVSRDE